MTSFTGIDSLLSGDAGFYLGFSSGGGVNVTIANSGGGER